MGEGLLELEDLSKEEIVGLIEDGFRNITSHTGLWFWAVEDELGMGEALRLDEIAWQNGSPIQFRRLGLDEGIRSFPSGWSKDDLIALLGNIAKNWLTNDGVWFQAVEREHGMGLAKKCNDKAEEKFTVIEAKRIMRRLPIPEKGGIAALEQALRFRLYARLDRQEIQHVNENTIIFRMNDCRVQSARKKKNLPDYPCKSAGIVEYTYFATAIDPRIETRCIVCPPDAHPKEYYCAWEFQLKQ